MKRKSLLFIAALAMAISLFAAFGVTASAYSGGTGTASNPYIIQNINDLKELHDNVRNGNTYNGKYFKVTAGINMSNSESWDPIGYYYTETDNKPFEGTIDGDSKTITLYIDRGKSALRYLAITKERLKIWVFTVM